MLLSRKSWDLTRECRCKPPSGWWSNPTLLMGTMGGEAAAEHVWTYPAPGQDEYKSEHYTAEVAQGSNSKEVFVYQTLFPWHHYYKAGNLDSRHVPVPQRRSTGDHACRTQQRAKRDEAKASSSTFCSWVGLPYSSLFLSNQNSFAIVVFGLLIERSWAEQRSIDAAVACTKVMAYLVFRPSTRPGTTVFHPAW